MNLRIENGWAIITAGTLEIHVQADDSDGADDRVEVRKYDPAHPNEGTRLWVEPVGDTLTATAAELFG